MRYLVLSDIHGNWEALEAVLAAARGECDEVICLGDLVGYGADPNPVTDWVRENSRVVVRGNHDKVCCGLEEPALFNASARAAAIWTGQQLTPENRRYLRELPQGPLEHGEFSLTHGSPLDEDEYLVSLRDAVEQFEAAAGRLIFFGHTHVQGAFFLRAIPHEATRASPGQLHVSRGETCLLNPGSVGQPRDLDWRAAYALWDSESRLATFRRSEYDVAAAQRKILDAGLPPGLAERLEQGR